MSQELSLHITDARDHISLIDRERSEVKQLQELLSAYYRQECENPAGQPELIRNEVENIKQLLEDIERRREILEEFIEDVFSWSVSVNELLTDAKAELARFADE